jgi:hypothetical protein
VSLNPRYFVVASSPSRAGDPAASGPAIRSSDAPVVIDDVADDAYVDTERQLARRCRVTDGAAATRKECIDHNDARRVRGEQYL